MAVEAKRYIFTGCAKGRIEVTDERTREKYMRDWFKIYVMYPVSDFRSENYEAEGFKTEAFSAVGPEIWENILPGEEVNIYFTDDKINKKAALMTSTGRSIQLEAM